MEINNTNNGPSKVFGIFWSHRKLWVIPTAIGAVLGLAIAVLMPRYWDASQAILVRNEAQGSESHRPGEFPDLDNMKTAQETLLEIAKSRQVIEATLKEVGPTSGWNHSNSWPSAVEVANFRKRVVLSPPGGAEFGKTEVAYLQLSAKGKEHALALIQSLTNQLDKRFRELRDERAQSMVSELKDSASQAEKELVIATEKLAAFESEVGVDLTELRMLQSSPSATSDIRQQLVATENAKRVHDTNKLRNEQILTELRAALKNPDQIIVAPNSLLVAQPALRRLKDGLVDAQLTKSRLMGARTELHPEVLAAADVENRIRSSLRNELETAILGIEVDLAVSANRVDALDAQLTGGRDRLQSLAGKRAKYANLVALADNRMKLLESARNNLATARAAQASARSANLIQRIDDAETGVYPAGVGRSVVAAAGLFGGFAFGLGLLFLFVEFPSGTPSKSGQQIVVNEAPTPQESQSLRESMNDDLLEAVSSTSDEGAIFGMFRGMTLRDALQKVAAREKTDTKA